MLDGIRADLADPVGVDEGERRFGAAMRKSRQAPADNGMRIAQLERETMNMAEALARGLRSDALAQRLRGAEEALARLRTQVRAKRSEPALIAPNVRGRFLEMVKGLDKVLMRDPERGREELRGIISEKIRLHPDMSGRFLWAEYSLGIKRFAAEAVKCGYCGSGGRLQLFPQEEGAAPGGVKW